MLTRSVDADNSVKDDEGSEAEREETTVVIIKSSQSPQEVDEIVSWATAWTRVEREGWSGGLKEKGSEGERRNIRAP
jgi:hypothetical protein